MAPITHIVMFRFKEGVSAQAVKDISAKMLALKENCKHPKTQKPYIRSLVGGKDMSIEDLQDGITHAFVVEFDNIEDRDYYVRNDPVHQAFVSSVKEIVEKAQVVDFMHGVI